MLLILKSKLHVARSLCLLDSINLMRRHESGEPGIFDQKIPTTILLTPEGVFHSFGYAARDFYNDLEPKEATKWLYFDKFKMILHKEGVTILSLHV